jgi:ABC-type dipeptide/oligopeptide/nickel transport system permease subunit
MRVAGALLLISIMLLLILAPYVAPHSYATQFREAPDARASRQFPLGTDALGRDRFSRMLYGGRISLVCAPAAALVSSVLALFLALGAGCLGKRAERLAGVAADVCLSLPWLFALLAVRAALPLNAAPWATVAATFGLLGLLGWAGPARVILAAVKRHLGSDFVMFARAGGCSGRRVALVHILPNLLPLAGAQFLVTVPAFLLAEANLGLLGLGIPEPIPSLGGLLRELENLPGAAAHPWMFVPALLLFTVVGSFHLVVSADKYTV